MAPMGSYGLEVVRVTSNGRRYYGRAGKARLIEACLEPGISVARLALEHGVNANQLRKWVMPLGFSGRPLAQHVRTAGCVMTERSSVPTQTTGSGRKLLLRGDMTATSALPRMRHHAVRPQIW